MSNYSKPWLHLNLHGAYPNSMSNLNNKEPINNKSKVTPSNKFSNKAALPRQKQMMISKAKKTKKIKLKKSNNNS